MFALDLYSINIDILILRYLLKLLGCDLALFDHSDIG